MVLIRSLVSAFACFSRIPMPKLAWRDDSMRFMMGMFPLVGVGVALCMAGWWAFCDWLAFGVVMRAAGMVVVPLLATGAIHLDGFCDVVDAQVSQAPLERKKEILKDPHVGAFAVIGVALYLLAYFGICTELPLTWTTPLLVGLAYVLERALSSAAVLVFPKNSSQGMVATFALSADKKISLAFDCVFGLAAAVAMIVVSPVVGGCMCAGALCWWLGYRVFANWAFGGVSGDLAGFFTQVCEIGMMAILVVAARVCGL